MQNSKRPPVSNIKNHYQILLIFLIFWIGYSFILITKHNHFQTFTWDTGFFDQLIWKFSRFKDPVSSFTGLHIFGDHFQLVLLAFVPFYWLSQSLNYLWPFHVFIATSSAIFIYFIAIKVIEDKFFAISVSISFLLFYGFQHAVLDGIHQSVFSVFFLSLACLTLVYKNHKIYWFCIVGLLITKEEMALLAAALGLTLLFSKEKVIGIATFAFSIASFFLIIKLILPSIQGVYPHYDYGQFGFTPEEVFVNVAKNPLQAASYLVNSKEKIETVFQTFFSFGFIPLLSPPYLIMAFQQFTVRFLDTVSIHRWTNLNHYAFPLAPIMAISAIYGTLKIKNWVKNRWATLLISMYLLLISIFQNFYFHGPINSLLKKDFYAEKNWMRNNNEVIKQVPRNASVAATNNLGPHISRRDEFYLIQDNNFANYLIFDLDDGPNKYSPLNFQQTKDILKAEINSGHYQIYFQVGDAYLLKKKS